jgi:nuclear cap-binding protein subunit 1
VALSALPWGGEFYSKSESSNEFEAVLDAAEKYCKARTLNPDPASTIIKSADGKEIDWFVDMCERLNAARTDGNWHILSIPAIAEPFVEALSSVANTHALAKIDIPEKTHLNHAEAAAKYPGRSMLRYARYATEFTGMRHASATLLAMTNLFYISLIP